ncbi:unnamed protein product [Mesocestoides corti]|uniref:Uncharacterized protein n=1 Tax=Mesocestoides corti TaxID=53468 RepID=A0A0R3U8V0_MESCO|nr:unnamed protein product [Mesocestoides corti]
MSGFISLVLQVCLSIYDANDNLAAASLSSLAHLSHLLGTGCTMSHFSSLGGQLESRGFLTPSRTAYSTVYNPLTVVPNKKSISYWAGKRPWKCFANTLFPDASPKANRQAREQPFDAEKPKNCGGRKLREVAVLSAMYVPPVDTSTMSTLRAPAVKKFFVFSVPSSSTFKSLGEEQIKSTTLTTKSADKSPDPSVVDCEESSARSFSQDHVSPIQGDSSSPTLAPRSSPVADDCQWDDWTSDKEGDLAVKTSSLSLGLPTSVSKEEAEVIERTAQVEAILAELAPDIKPASRTGSAKLQNGLENRDQHQQSVPPISSGEFLRYQPEDVLSGWNDDEDVGGGEWDADDDGL